ncbi:DNA-directed RNA polymerase subunit alpha [Prosthecobacter algae]|uniref:DNA-directed RNA polymerase subunit alpha n=1 Tax=Prosthecobacter algae TaxID=1144682 RepID=A0ABP9NU49_9BACT
MSVRLARFEMPNRLVRNEATATDTYAQFSAEPFDKGYGHTIGNSLRRVLLSSLEGAAITSVKIRGAEHEFSTLPGVLEDVVQIVLNLKKVRFKHHSESKEARLLSISVDKEGAVTAGDIKEDNHYEVINKDLVICNLDRKAKFECEFEVRVGRGFSTWEENKRADTPIGVIPIDSIYSPVTRVKYGVENTRVGQNTDYDKLVLDVWTDGRIAPSDALLQAASILRHHLDVFVNYDDKAIEFEAAPEAQTEENSELRKLLNMSVNEIELSVRAANCLNNANITSVGQLAMKTEAEMLRYRNFGKKSLTEIKEKLAELGLSLGMKFDSSLLEPTSGGSSLLARSSMIADDDDEADAAGFASLIDSHLPDGDDDE